MPQGPLSTNIAVSPSKSSVPSQADSEGNLQLVQAHGDTYNATFNKRTFFAANQAGVTTSAGLATTYTGLCLSNPAGSTVNLSPRRVSGVLIVAPAALTAFGVIVGYSAAGVVTHTTPLTSLQPMFVGNAAVPQGLADAACTIVGTPAWGVFMGLTPSATGVASFSLELQGSFVIPPGGYLAIGTTIAGPASGLLASISWEEIAITG
jgi:hypothetical protein